MFRDIKNDPNSATREIENEALIMLSHNILKKNELYIVIVSLTKNSRIDEKFNKKITKSLIH